MKLGRKVAYKAKEAPVSFWWGSRNFKSISWGIFLHYCEFLKKYCINQIEYLFPLPMNIIPWPASSGVRICLQLVSFSMLIGLHDVASLKHFAQFYFFNSSRWSKCVTFFVSILVSALILYVISWQIKYAEHLVSCTIRGKFKGLISACVDNLDLVNLNVVS